MIGLTPSLNALMGGFFQRPCFHSNVRNYNYHKIRAGDYRAIVMLGHQKEVVDVRRIGHRRNIYEKIR